MTKLNDSLTPSRYAWLPPVSDRFLNDTSTVERAFMAACCLATSIILFIFVESVSCTTKQNYKSANIRYKSIQILGIYPVMATLNLLSMFVPRAFLFSQLVVSVYISWSMFNFVTLMTLYFGGQEPMLVALESSTKISFKAPPLCCCLCLPRISANERNMKRIKWMVLQGALLQPIIYSCVMVMWLDGRFRGKWEARDSFPYLSVIDIASTVICVYGFNIFFYTCRDHLRPLSIESKFSAIHFAFILAKLQPIIFEVLSEFDIPAGTKIISSKERGHVYYQMALIFEIVILSLYARKFYKASHGDTSDQRYLGLQDKSDHEKDAEIAENELEEQQPKNNGTV